MTNPYREAPAREPEDAFQTMTGEALTRTAQQYGVERTLGEADDTLRKRIRSFMAGGHTPLTPKEWTEGLRLRALQAGEPFTVAEEILGNRPRQSPIVSIMRVVVVDDEKELP